MIYLLISIRSHDTSVIEPDENCLICVQNMFIAYCIKSYLFCSFAFTVPVIKTEKKCFEILIFVIVYMYRDILEIEIYWITKLLFSVKDNPYFKWYISLNTFELNIQKHSLVSEVVCLQCSCADQRFEDQLAFPK